MNCFMSYNPNVAHDVKVTTWIKEFDGASPVYPSFPNEGDVFIVFDNDEATEPSVNKTYTNGDWADTSSGDAPSGTIYITENGEGIDVSSYAYADVNVSGGSSDFSTAEVTFTNNYENPFICLVPNLYDGELFDNIDPEDMDGTSGDVVMYNGKSSIILLNEEEYALPTVEVTGNLVLSGSGRTIYVTGNGTVTFS